MERSEDYGNIAVALAEMRPTPRAEFSLQLDEWAAAGFPRHRESRRPRFNALIAWLRTLTPRRLALATAAAALVAIVVATVVVAGRDSGRGPVALDTARRGRAVPSVQFAESIPVHPSKSAGRDASSDGSGAYIRPFSRKAPHATEFNSALGAEGESTGALVRPTPGNLQVRHREIERSAEIALLADPADVADDSAKVFAAVHDADGIVLHSSTSSGKGAGARFELLIPSARLGDALAAFSSIDEVRSRHEATDDITKPTVSTEEELRDSQVRVDSLLAQLSGAEAESEREAIAAELHAERSHAARLRSQLARLHRRTTYSRVLVRIQSGNSPQSGGAWGLDDSFHDAGHILGIAAGVTLVGLAVIAPLALLVLLAWLTQRLWLRTRRERALDA